MTRLIQRLEWRGILMGALLIIGRFTVVWAGNVSTNIQDDGVNVGIGTTSPGASLDVPGNSNTQSTLKVGYGTWSTSAATPVAFIQGRATTAGVLQVLGTGNSPSGLSNLLALHPDGASSTAVFVVNRSGSLGIGTTNPAARLHVVGDVQVDGNLAAKYQDVAEWVQASSPLPSGTVVVVDHQGRNQVLPASQSYDTRVAGVVSARPGLLLGEAGPDKVKVAQSGRVKVKVDASYGPIAAGDLLVTSLTLGHAMRSTPVSLGETLIHRPGTLLGKALEPLEEGQGEILVLLTLQ